MVYRPGAPTRTLTRWAANHRLTVNTLVQGLWSLVLGCLTQRASIVTGVVVAGRPAVLPDVERTVGAFINTLALPVRIETAAPLVSWLHAIQDGMIDSQRFGYWPLPRVYAWAGLPAEPALFDTVLVCENYPIRDAFRLRDVTMREIELRAEGERAGRPRIFGRSPADLPAAVPA